MSTLNKNMDTACMGVRNLTIEGSTPSVRIFSNGGSTPTKFVDFSIRFQYSSSILIGITILKTVQSPFYSIFKQKGRKIH